MVGVFDGFRPWLQGEINQMAGFQGFSDATADWQVCIGLDQDWIKNKWG